MFHVPVPIHVRVRIGGQLFNDASWSVGCAFALDNGDSPLAGDNGATETLEGWRDNIRALNTSNILPENLRDLLSLDGSIDMIRCSRIGTDGRETHVALLELATPVKGTGDSNQPAQAAVAASLTTGRPGASYRGRMYWPAIGLAATQGRVASSLTQPIAADTANWLNAVGDAGLSLFTVHLQPCVVSTTRNVLTLVTGVRVGNRFDTQRRRAESQDELYGSAVVPN